MLTAANGSASVTVLVWWRVVCVLVYWPCQCLALDLFGSSGGGRGCIYCITKCVEV
jgi:hypothetical protein